MKYDYREYEIEDVKEVLSNYNLDDFDDLDDFEQKLNDDLWIDDSVTGNGSGSYTFNTNVAKEYVEDNFDLLLSAYREFGYCEFPIAEEEWEKWDVTIRCYLLAECIQAAILETSEIVKKFEDEFC